MKKDGTVLEFASDELRGDKEVVLVAVSQSWRALEFASEELHRDKEVVLHVLKDAVRHNTANDVLHIFNGSLSENLRADKEVVGFAVGWAGKALEFSSNDLRGDMTMVYSAVRQDPEAFQYASKELRGDKVKVMTLMRFHSHASGVILKYVSEELRRDKNVGRRALLDTVSCRSSSAEDVLQMFNSSFSENLRADKKMVLHVVKRVGKALEFASDNLRGNKKVVMTAVQVDGAALQYTGEKLRGDKELVTAAVRKSGKALEYALN